MAAREIASEAVLTGRRMWRNWAFEITDQDGKIVLTLPFKDALD